MSYLLIFPGQGSQKPGMAHDLAEAFPAAREARQAADAALGEPLSRLLFEGPADELTRTHNAQPALLAHGAALWAVLGPALGPHTVGAAGHSLGEFTAWHAAGALSLADAVTLVRRRGALMYETGTQRPGTMAAILGTLGEPIDALCAKATEGLVVPANYNGDEQVVVSGEVAGVQQLMTLAKAAGAKRAVPLQVSGAFHSPLMAPAQDGLRQALDAARWTEPAFPVWSNVTTQAVTASAEGRRQLLAQLTSPVRWTQQVRAMAAAHPGATFVELGPGNVLTGLVKRLAPDNPTLTCGTAAEVEALLARLA